MFKYVNYDSRLDRNQTEIMASFIGGEFVRLMDAVMRTKPDISYRSAALGGATFAAVPGVDALGQNHFDLPISATAGGLRVYILPDTELGLESDNWTYSLASFPQSGVSVDQGTRVIQIGFAAGALLSAMKTIIDAHVALESRYYGSQDGTAVAVAVASTTVNNASATVQSFARVIANGDLRWSIGDAAPDVNGDGQELLLDGDALLVEVPAGERLWFARDGTADAGGSVAIWKEAA